MKTILKTTMVIGFIAAMFLTVQFARADECQIGTKQDMLTQMNVNPDITGGRLSAEQTALLIAKKGPPPNAAGEPLLENIEFYRYDAKNGLSVVFVVSGACVENALGPVLTDDLDATLEIVKAGRID